MYPTGLRDLHGQEPQFYKYIIMTVFVCIQYVLIYCFRVIIIIAYKFQLHFEVT